jgi:hypothetical protein
MTGFFLQPLRNWRANLRLGALAKEERRRDARGLTGKEDPGIEPCMRACLDWLGEAQDHSTTADGGVARHFSLNTGWGPSYPETTGYIVPTLLDCARLRNDDQLRQRARRMLDFFLRIQLPEGGFQGGVIGATPVKATTFNTGQILLGLAAGALEFGEPYTASMHRAARWLVETQDSDGAWRKHSSPFTQPGEKTYETHVAWGLLEAARVAPCENYGEAALANVRWALRSQESNGWFRDCCLSDPVHPLTHTIGYVLRGVVEAYRFSADDAFFDAAHRTATALLKAQSAEGALPGRLDCKWAPAADWCCLTGNVQIAHCWLMLHRMKPNMEFLRAGKAANRYVRRTIHIEGPAGIRGGVKGSFPVWGEYLTWEYPNWAAKFFLDSCLLENSLNG